MKKILFITSTRLGDGILSMGVLAHFIRLYPDAEITVACGPLIAGLFIPVPQVKKVIALKKQSYARHWIGFGRQTLGQKWDIVIDLRNSLLSRLLRADKKYIWGRQDKSLHKVEQMAGVIGVSPPPAPTVWFDALTSATAEKLIPPGSPVLAIGPTAMWRAKTWPVENFIDLVRRLTAAGGIFENARIAVFAAPGEEAVARQLFDSLPEDRRIDVIAKGAPLYAAAALKRCDFYIGNDSGLMHTAAAVGVPTLGLFGPGFPDLYRPWGDHCAYVATPETSAELRAYAGYDPDTAPCLMTTLTVTAAYEAAVALHQKLSA